MEAPSMTFNIINSVMQDEYSIYNIKYHRKMRPLRCVLRHGAGSGGLGYVLEKDSEQRMSKETNNFAWAIENKYLIKLLMKNAEPFGL